MRRLLTAIVIGFVAVLAIVPIALGGGWAHIQPDQGAFEPPAGTPTDLGFTVLQHGQTPVSQVSPAVVVTDLVAGSSRTYPATQSGPVGHFVATVTLASAGLHTWEVTMPDLIVEGSPTTFVALEADGSMPAISPAVLLDLAAARADAAGAQPGATAIEPTTPTVGGTSANGTSAASQTAVAALTSRVEAVASDVSRLNGELDLMRVLLTGLAVTVVALLGVVAVLAWPRRRPESTAEIAGSEAAVGR